MSKLEVGHKAPDFSLLDNNNIIHNLADYKGQWLVLFFYPKDNTPGCTIEACRFSNDYADILAINAKVLGINTDSSNSHTDFINKQQLPFPLLSDSTASISKSYQSLFKLGPIKFCKRHTFIIAPEGNIAKIYREVKPSSHSQQVIADLTALQAN